MAGEARERGAPERVRVPRALSAGLGEAAEEGGVEAPWSFPPPERSAAAETQLGGHELGKRRRRERGSAHGSPCASPPHHRHGGSWGFNFPYRTSGRGTRRPPRPTRANPGRLGEAVTGPLPRGWRTCACLAVSGGGGLPEERGRPGGSPGRPGPAHPPPPALRLPDGGPRTGGSDGPPRWNLNPEPGERLPPAGSGDDERPPPPPPRRRDPAPRENSLLAGNGEPFPARA